MDSSDAEIFVAKHVQTWHVSVGLGTFKFQGVRRSFWDKKFQYDKPRLIALFCYETSKKRKTVCMVDQFGLSKFCVSDTERPHGVCRQLHAPVMLKPKQL